ncbi:MAG: nucleotidyltransferase family protein [Clostridia bacterium]|nr:nucleotidyltransferase family protein [Clostridia bacterium]
MNILIDILSAQLNQVALSPEVRARLTPELLSKLYRIAKRHDLAHVVGAVVMENGVEIPSDLTAKFKKTDMLAVYRCAQQKQALEEIAAQFEMARIPYVPLKGAVLKSFYPTETMRTSCDVDILVRQEDLERACSVLVSAGYRVEEHLYHDISLSSPTNVHLELHFSVQENMPEIDTVLSRVWEYAVREDGCRHAFTKEFFVFQTFAHMAYHFLSGGCGLKALADLWVMEHRMGLTYLDGEVLLAEGGILEFAGKMTALTRTCFDGAPEEVYSKPLLDYIVAGGSYGTAKGKITIKKSEKGGTVGYALRRVLLPYNTMKNVYPVLERVPVLLPFCWMHRLFSRLFTGRGRRAIGEIKTAQRITAAQTEEMQELRAYLGL